MSPVGMHGLRAIDEVERIHENARICYVRASQTLPRSFRAFPSSARVNIHGGLVHPQTPQEPVFNWKQIQQESFCVPCNKAHKSSSDGIQDEMVRCGNDLEHGQHHERENSNRPTARRIMEGYAVPSKTQIILRTLGSLKLQNLNVLVCDARGRSATVNPMSRL